MNVEPIIETKALIDGKYQDSGEWEHRLGRVADLVKQVLNIGNVHIRLIGADGNWIRLESGTPVTEIRDGNMLCDSALVGDGILEVTNAETDSRILDHTLQNFAPELKCYFGHPLQTPSGERVGVMCAWDTSPRTLTDSERQMFEDIVYWVQREILRARDLDRAAQVQQGLQPIGALNLPGYQLAGFCQPTLAVGGDFYDWQPNVSGATFALADVMGKGLGSAIIAATVRAVFRAGSYDHDVEKVVQIASEILEPDLEKARAFVTLIYGRIDLESNIIHYIDAGHGLTLHVSAGGTVTRLATENFPFGIGISEKWDVHAIEMNPGDTLMCLSDGMLDIFDGRLDALDELGDVALAGETAEEVVDLIRQMAERWKTPDDVTALVVRRNK
jgi:hypothetical protein